MKLPIRFIHTSDWQLGMTRVFLGKEAAPRFSQDRIDAIRKLGELAEEHDAAFIVVAGDVFESNQLSRQTVLRTLEALKAVSVPVFLLPGNHDPLDAASIFSTQEFQQASTHIIVIRDDEPIPVPGIPGVEVMGAPWRTKRPSSDLCADLVEKLKPSEDVLRIAVAHGQVDTMSPDTSRPDIISLETMESAINDRRIHYLALGDRHSVTNVGTTGRIWYSGAPVATDFVESDPNKALLVELSDKDDCHVTPLLVGDWQFIAKQWELNSFEDLDQLTTWLESLPNKERTILKIGFTGSISLAIDAHLQKVLDDYEEVFASLRQRERTTDLVIVPDELDQDSVDLSGYAHETWDELLTLSENDPVARNALRLLYRLSQQGATQ
jgi:DNA repair exonuclease SbcCD nuclease subunit